MSTRENNSATKDQKLTQNQSFADTQNNSFNNQQFFEKEVHQSTYNDILSESYDEECLSILQVDQDTSRSEKDKQGDFIQTKLKSLNNKEKQKAGCGCSKSNCLRLHCSCFKNQGFCSDDCRCQNCLNSKQYEKVRNFVLEKTKIISRASFREELVKYNDTLFSKRGCRCTQGCNQKYCFCSKNNAKCSSICKCVSCKNEKVYIDKQEIKKVFEYLPRKKYKISINFDPLQKKENQKNTCSVEFKDYKDDYKPTCVKTK